MSNKEEYNSEPVFYCKNCLSLKIRDMKLVEDSEYCEECGSTDIGQLDIRNWDALYIRKYGHHYLEKY